MGRWAEAGALLKNSSSHWRNRGGFGKFLFLFEYPFVFCCSLNDAKILMPPILWIYWPSCWIVTNFSYFTWSLLLHTWPFLFFKQPQIGSFYFSPCSLIPRFPCKFAKHSRKQFTAQGILFLLHFPLVVFSPSSGLKSAQFFFFSFFNPTCILWLCPFFWQVSSRWILEHFCLSVNCPSQISQGHWLLNQSNLQKEAQGQEWKWNKVFPWQGNCLIYKQL